MARVLNRQLSGLLMCEFLQGDSDSKGEQDGYIIGTGSFSTSCAVALFPSICDNVTECQAKGITLYIDGTFTTIWMDYKDSLSVHQCP